MAKQTQTKKSGPTADAGNKRTNGSVNASAKMPAADPVDNAGDPRQDPELANKVAAMRAHVRDAFGKVVMAMMMLPRYRHQTLGDLQHLVLEPLIRDRIAIAYPGDTERSALSDVVGFAIWASVSEEVDAEIRQQIKAGVFPIRLKPEAWNSGSINWLLDVIAPNRKMTASVIANLKQVVKEGNLRLHPLVTRLVDPETLEKMGAEKMSAEKPSAPA
ncbi:MAG: cytolysin-activating lysine-acyltransferase [Hyphomicrobiales bacterium]